MKILLIDDYESVLQTIEPLLASFGHDVVTAKDGQDGLDKFFESPHSFNVIITDIDMPNVNGVEFVEILTSKGYIIPTILMTGNPDLPDTSNISYLALLKKPFKIANLLDLVNKADECAKNS